MKVIQNELNILLILNEMSEGRRTGCSLCFLLHVFAGVAERSLRTQLILADSDDETVEFRLMHTSFGFLLRNKFSILATIGTDPFILQH